ncbi:response regulator transcription factor [Catenulispora subtropica]|uniref:Response regulatory domain-containing protein n=1 Tax=Catenulispora subtropica TaxID=450798 RepID=A0ABN2SVT1_9ACTN
MTEPGPPRVLVVDDSDVVRSLIRINLELEGFEVLEADSGARCLELVPGADVVTLDLLLPVLPGAGPGGLDVLRRLKRDPALGGPRVVVVTAAALPEDRRRGESAGADAYITKPFEPGDLVDAVRALSGGGAR